MPLQKAMERKLPCCKWTTNSVTDYYPMRIKYLVCVTLQNYERGVTISVVSHTELLPVIAIPHIASDHIETSHIDTDHIDTDHKDKEHVDADHII